MMTRRTFLSACLVTSSVDNLASKIADDAINKVWRYDVAGDQWDALPAIENTWEPPSRDA